MLKYLKPSIPSLRYPYMKRLLMSRSDNETRVANSAVELWRPESIEKMHMTAFAKYASERTGKNLLEWKALHKWSITCTGLFWDSIAQFCDVKWMHKCPEVKAYVPSQNKGHMRGARWFEGSTLNFAQNLMPNPDSRNVLICVSENIDFTTRKFSGRQLEQMVARCARSLLESGVYIGDSVCGVLTNSVESIVCMLASASLGAVWSSCSPDFGISGMVERLSQVKPKVVFYVEEYYYGGKHLNCMQHLEQVMEGLQVNGVPPKMVVVPYWGEQNKTLSSDLPRGSMTYRDFIDESSEEAYIPLTYTPVPFNHPLYVMFSSGTTGLPKCIQHGTGGTLLNHKKELMLHCDLHSDDKLFFYTTTGWMMWNWMVSALSIDGVTVVTYDGSPAYPDVGALWEIASKHSITHLGASPKYFSACMSSKLDINSNKNLASNFDLSKLRTILSTGSPLLPEHYQWIYYSVKKDVHLASISGGTDILGCFMCGNPNLPVYSGEIQCAGLGMDICAYDDELQGCVVGQKGELVCQTPFPSMPIRFGNDEFGEKYRDAYFSKGEHMWRHGDFVEITARGGVIVHGRSDATLNPGGVRIGTAEIYRQLEGMEGISDSIAIGCRNQDGDVDVILFVKVEPGYTFDQSTVASIKKSIREGLTPRHVPKDILQVQNIPYTLSGKKVEVSVTRIFHGEKVANISSLVNPECLDEYNQIAMSWRNLKR